MYETIPSLVKSKTIGDQFLIKNMASYIITIDTFSAINKQAFDFIVCDSSTHVSDALKNNEKFSSLDINNEVIYVIEFLDKCNINYSKFDYLVISNAGKYNVRCLISNVNNIYDKTSDHDQTYGRSLYLDIQSIRIALIEQNIIMRYNNCYRIFNYGIKTCCGYFVFKYLCNDFYQNTICVNLFSSLPLYFQWYRPKITM